MPRSAHAPTRPRARVSPVPPSPRPGPSRAGLLGSPWFPPVALVLLVGAVYARSLLVPILEWDDSVYLFRDARLAPLTLQSLGRILTQPFFANFHPVTTLTFALDRAVWGTWVPGFHLTHLAFYIGGVVALYFLFARVLRSRPAGLVAAAIYGVHTIHVESAAWLASRKDVVCLLFYALALLAYARYASATRSRWRPYALAVVFTAAAMFSKGYAVILPAALLAYDLCFAGRLARRHAVDKIPFLAIAAATVLLTVHAQDRDSALIESSIAGGRRVALLAKIFALYAGRTLVPVDLSAFYTVAGERAGAAAILGLLLAAALVAGFFFLRRRVPAAAFGIALYLLPLATVMNFFFTLRIWMADRYLFFPTIGSSLALVALGAHALRRRAAEPRRAGSRPGVRRWARVALPTTATLLVLFYAGLTYARIGVWTSRVELWSDVLRKELRLRGSGPLAAADLARITNLGSVPSSPVVNLMQAYEAAGNRAEAGRIAALLGTGSGKGDFESVMTLARAELEAGRLDQAVERLRPIASGTSWVAPLATMWIAFAEGQTGDSTAARRTIERGIALYRRTGQPATDGLFSIAAMEFNRGRYARAAEWYGLAQRESPRDARVAYHLARALEEQGNVDRAMSIYRRIAASELEILPGSAFSIFDVYLQMGIIAEKRGRIDEAIGYCEEALRRVPNHPKRDMVRSALATLRAKSR